MALHAAAERRREGGEYRGVVIVFDPTPAKPNGTERPHAPPKALPVFVYNLAF